jgi:hypothetical protein
VENILAQGNADNKDHLVRDELLVLLLSQLSQQTSEVVQVPTFSRSVCNDLIYCYCFPRLPMPR